MFFITNITIFYFKSYSKLKYFITNNKQNHYGQVLTFETGCIWVRVGGRVSHTIVLFKEYFISGMFYSNANIGVKR